MMLNIWIFNATYFQKEFRKTEKQNPNLEYNAVPYPSQMQSVETTDNESNSEGEDRDTFPASTRHKQNSGYSAASDESEIVLFEKEGLEHMGKHRRRRKSDGMIIEKRCPKIREVRDKKVKPPDTTPKSTYNVSDNESLNTIALKFNISPNMLKQINAMTSSVIFPGQSLIVPLQKAQKEVIETVLQPVNVNVKAEERKKNKFFKYDMKRITRFDGAVTGTTLLTTNVFMFRSCVTEPLVIRNTQQRYDVTIPLDSFTEILMFDCFDKMLAVMETDGIVSGEDACPECQSMKSRIHRDSNTSLTSLEDEEMRAVTPTPLTADSMLESAINESNDAGETEICDFDIAFKGVADESIETEVNLESMSYEDTPDFQKTSLESTTSSTSQYSSNSNGSYGRSRSGAGSFCSNGSARCRHEFRDFLNEKHVERYTAQNRVNPFNSGPLNIVLPERAGHSHLGASGALGQSTIGMTREDSDPNLATAEFLKKIDETTTITHASISRPLTRKFPFFILLQGVFCTRTYGQPSYYRLHQEKHKLVQFWFSLMEGDITDFITNIKTMCPHLKDVTDDSNCLLRCSEDHFDKVKDAILPEAAPKYEPRVFDPTILLEDFSGNLYYKDGISVMLTTELMCQLQPYLPCHIIGVDMHLVYSLRVHGMSLKSMYQRSAPYTEYPTLLVVKDTQGFVFGAYMSDGVKESVRYYGTGETFLFTLRPEVSVHPWQGTNQFFMMGTNQYFTIGAGNGQFALYVTEMLDRGTSNRSETFYNKVLSSTSEFNILDVEVWTFADESLIESSESSGSDRGGNFNLQANFPANFTRRGSAF